MMMIDEDYRLMTMATMIMIVLMESERSDGKDQGGIKCANRRTGFIDSEGSHR